MQNLLSPIFLGTWRRLRVGGTWGIGIKVYTNNRLRLEHKGGTRGWEGIKGRRQGVGINMYRNNPYLGFIFLGGMGGTWGCGDIGTRRQGVEINM